MVHQHEIHGRPQVVFVPARSLVSRRGRRILNGVAIHRTSLPRFHSGAGRKCSYSRRGRISPRVIARIKKRRGPVHGDARQQTAGARRPDRDQLDKGARGWNKKKPGIIETTAEKPSAANGRCRRLATGVTMTLTMMQATKAPVATLADAIEITAQRTACANMPTAIGNGSRRHGIEKKVPNAATADPVRNHVSDQRRRRQRSGSRKGCTGDDEPEPEPGADHQHEDARIGQARDAERDARAREIDSAVEEMRTGHQHHTGTERDQRYRLRQLESGRQRQRQHRR